MATYNITDPVGTPGFIDQCEIFALQLVKDRLRVKHILGFLTRLKNGLYENKEMAVAMLSYCAAKQTAVRSNFCPTFKSVLENYTLSDAWTVLETVLSYHALYGGEI